MASIRRSRKNLFLLSLSLAVPAAARPSSLELGQEELPQTG
jgi:hypothetical protein